MRVASFPGPAQLSVLQVTESWGGPGNEVRVRECIAVHLSGLVMYKEQEVGISVAHTTSEVGIVK